MKILYFGTTKQLPANKNENYAVTIIRAAFTDVYNEFVDNIFIIIIFRDV